MSSFTNYVGNASNIKGHVLKAAKASFFLGDESNYGVLVPPIQKKSPDPRSVIALRQNLYFASKASPLTLRHSPAEESTSEFDFYQGVRIISGVTLTEVAGIDPSLFEKFLSASQKVQKNGINPRSASKAEKYYAPGSLLLKRYYPASRSMVSTNWLALTPDELPHTSLYRVILTKDFDSEMFVEHELSEDPDAYVLADMYETDEIVLISASDPDLNKQDRLMREFSEVGTPYWRAHRMDIGELQSIAYKAQAAALDKGENNLSLDKAV